MNPLLEILHHGPLCHVQDAGRLGHRYLGIPPAGAMDTAAFRLANRLLDNAPATPVLECVQGARLQALVPLQLSLAGLGYARAWIAEPGERIEIGADRPGVWHYLALPGGVVAPHWLGSASVCLRAQIGTFLPHAARVASVGAPLSAWPPGIIARYPAPTVAEIGAIRLWPGPQWAQFPISTRKALCAQDWEVSIQSDRSGYRLQGVALAVPQEELLSEPVRIGAIQIPPDGQPIVCLNDGPTVGGYPKIAVIAPEDLARFVQTRPGTTLRFTMHP